MYAVRQGDNAAAYPSTSRQSGTGAIASFAWKVTNHKMLRTAAVVPDATPMRRTTLSSTTRLPSRLDDTVHRPHLKRPADTVGSTVGIRAPTGKGRMSTCRHDRAGRARRRLDATHR